MKKIISFIGAPGCGKGFLIKKFTETATRNNMLSPENIAIISIGNIIRTEIKNQTKLGIKIQKSKREGCLAPDSLIIPLLKKELHKTKAKEKEAEEAKKAVETTARTITAAEPILQEIGIPTSAVA